MIVWIKNKLIMWLAEGVMQEIWDSIYPEKHEVLEAAYNANYKLRQVLEHLHPLSAAQILMDENEIPKTIIKSRVCETCGYRYFKCEDEARRG